MASLIHDYEQQYSSITADITFHIGRISVTNGTEKQNHVRQAEKLFEEASELLEQLELEVKEQDSKDRQKYHTRIRSYKAELTKQQTDMKRAKLGVNSSRDELLGDDTHDSEDQRTRLLDNTERLDRSSRKLEQGYRIAVETEEIGNQIIENLSTQRETIERTRGRLHDMDTVLGKSSRVMSSMMKRIVQNRIMLVGVGLLIVTTISIAIYFMVR